MTINTLLIAVLAFLALNAWIGMKRGLVKTIFSMFSFILTILLTALLHPMVNKALQENEKIVSYFSEKVEAALPFEEMTSNVMLNTEKAVQEEFLKNLPLPENIVKTLGENNNDAVYHVFGVDSFSKYLSRSIVSLIINSLSFAATFLVVFLLLKILSISLNLVSKLPVLNEINHLFGLAAGLIYAIIIVWAACILLTMAAGTETGSNLMKMVNENKILSFIYNNNLLVSRMTDLSKTLPK